MKSFRTGNEMGEMPRGKEEAWRHTPRTLHKSTAQPMKRFAIWSRALRHVVGLGMLVMLPGCASLLSTSITEIHPGNSAVVSAVEYRTGFLHLILPDIDIQPKLRAQCPSGIVNGIQTTLSVREFIIFQQYEIRASGYCK